MRSLYVVLILVMSSLNLFSQSNQALYLNDATSNIMLKDSTYLQEEWTMSFWVKPNKPGNIVGANPAISSLDVSDEMISRFRLDLDSKGNLTLYLGDKTNTLEEAIEFGKWNLITFTYYNGCLHISANLSSFIGNCWGGDFAYVMMYFGSLPKGKIEDGHTSNHYSGIVGYIDQINIFPKATPIEDYTTYYNIIYSASNNDLFAARRFHEDFSEQSDSYVLNKANIDISDCFVPILEAENGYFELLSSASPKSKNTDASKFSFNRTSGSSSFALISSKTSEFYNMNDANIGMINLISSDTVYIQSQNLESIDISLPRSMWVDNVSKEKFAVFIYDENDAFKEVLLTLPDQDNQHLDATIPIYSDFQKIIVGGVSNVFSLSSDNGFGPFKSTFTKELSFSISNASAYDEVELKFFDKMNNIVVDSIKSTDLSDSVTITTNVQHLSSDCELIATAMTSNNPGVKFTMIEPISIVPLNLHVTSSRGFHPYRIGTANTLDTISVDSIPANTNKIVFELVDNNGIALGSGDEFNKTVTGSNLSDAEWILNLSELPLVLGTQIKITVFQDGGFTDGTTEMFSLMIQPQNMYIGAEFDDWSFYTNAFNRANNYENPWPEVDLRFPHRFRVWDVPPRTRKIDYHLYSNDSLLTSNTMLPQYGQTEINTATFAIQMDSIPINANIMKCYVHADGGPDNGLEVVHIVHMQPNAPRISLDPVNFDPVPNNPLDTNQKKHTPVNITVEPSFTGCKEVELKILTDKNKAVIDTILSVTPATNGQGQSLGYDVAKVEIDFANLDPSSKYIYAKAIDPNGIFLSDSTYEIHLKTPIPIISTLVPFKKTYTNIPDTIDYIQGQGLYETFEFSGLPEKTTKVEIDFNLENYLRKVLNFSGNNQAGIASKETTYADYPTYNTQYTITARFKTTTTSGGVLAAFLDNAEFDGSTKYNRVLWVGDDGKLHFYNSKTKDTPYEIVISTSNSYNDGTWHQVTASYYLSMNENGVDIDESGFRIYVDGQKVAEESRQGNDSAFTIDYISGYWRVGHSIAGSYAPQPTNLTFNGSLSDVGILVDGMTNDFAAKLFNANLSNPAEIRSLNFQYFWDLKGTGNEFVSQNNLNFTGSPTWVDDEEHIFDVKDIVSKSFTSLNGPEKYAMQFNGDGTYLAKNDITIRGFDDEITGTINGLKSYTMSLWFKTTASAKQLLASFNYALDENENQYNQYTELILDSTGHISFIFNKDCEATTLTTEDSYNDDQWHHVAIVRDNGVMKIFVDGSLTDTHKGSSDCSFSFVEYDLFIAGNPHSNTNSFSGELSYFSFWSIAMKYQDIIKFMFEPKSMITTNIESFLECSEDNIRAGNQIQDITDDWGESLYSIMGPMNYQWKSLDYLTMINYPVNMAKLSKGLYELDLKLFFNHSEEIGAEFKWIAKLNNPWYNNSSDVTVNLDSDGGFGYFTEGANNELNLSLVTNQFNTGESLNFSIYDRKPSEPNPQLLLTQNVNAKSPNTNIAFNVSSAKPGSWIEISANNNRLFYPLLVRPGIPPKLSGNMNNVVEAIAPGTMKDTRKFTISNHEDAVTKVLIRAVNFADEAIADTVLATKIDESNWEFSYDVSKLRAPHSYLILESYFNTNPIPDTIIHYPIDVAKTRPDWFTEYMAFSNVSDENGTISFNLNGFIDKPVADNYLASVDFAEYDPFASNAPKAPDFYTNPDAIRTFTIPNKIPLFGGKLMQIPYTELDINLSYDKKSRAISITDAPVIRITDDYFGVLSKSDSIVISDYQNLLDSNNNIILMSLLDYSYQGNLFGPSLLTTTLRLKEILDDIRDLEIADIAKLYFDIQPAYATVRGQFVNMASDTNSWGSVGISDVKDFNINDIPSNKNISSFGYRQDGIGLTIGVGADLLLGLADVNITMTSRFMFGVLSAYHDLPIPKYKKYFAANNQIFVQADAEFCWGLIDKTFFGPELVHSFHLTDNGIPQIIPNPKDWIGGINSKPGEKIQAENKTNKSVFNYISGTAPQPEMDSYDGNVAAIFLEQDVNNKSAKLMLSYFTKEDNKFHESVVVAENKNGMSHPQISVFANMVYMTWVQNRHNTTNMPQGADFSYLVRTSDIWYAVYDIENEELLHKSAINDNFEEYMKGRLEGRPYIAGLSETEAMITWLVADEGMEGSDLYFTKLNYDGSMFAHSEPAILYETEDKESDLNIARISNGHCLVSWKISSNSGDDQKIVSSYWDGQMWSQPTVVVESHDSFKINHLDFDAHDDNGILAISTHSIGHDNPDQIHVYHWDNELKRWNSKGLIHELSETYPKEIKVSVNNDKAVVLLEEGKSYVMDDSHLGETDILLYKFDNPNEFKHIDSNPLVASQSAMNWHFDMDFVNNDIMLLLTNEIQNPGNTHLPENGKIFGNPGNNLILKAFKVNSNNELEDVDEDEILSVDQETVNYTDELLIDIYPQPALEDVTISNKLSSPIRLNAVYDIDGKLIQNYNIEIYTSHNLNLDLSSGLYFLEFRYGNSIVRKPIIKMDR